MSTREGDQAVRKLLKWVGIGLGSLVGTAVIAAIVLVLIGSSRLDRTFDITPQTLTLPTAEDTVARGRHLEAAVLGCTDCHGEDLGGGPFLDEPSLFKLHAPNLTAGQGGVGARYSDADWVRALRHGVDPDGKGLLFMPADVFNHLSAEDLVAVIAYVKSFPPVDNQLPGPEFSPLGRIIIGLGQLPEPLLVPALGIDHDAPFTRHVAPAASAEYGAYLTSIAYCTLCHGTDLSGGTFPYPDPNAPPVPSLAAAGGWTEEQFMVTLRTGVTPYGKAIDQAFMPWGDYDMSDEELKAIWLYLQSSLGASR